MDPARLSVVVEHASGATTRWGADEPQGRNVPRNISFSTSIPGGFRDCSLALPRRVDLDYPDLQLLDSIKLIGPGGEIAWEGRIQQFPRRHSDTSEITVGAVGWGAHLKDDPTVQLIGCDRRPDAWTEPPQARRIQILSAGDPYATDYVASANARSLRFDGTTRKEIEGGSTVELWYSAPAGHLIAKGAYRATQANIGADVNAPEWFVTDNDDGTGGTSPNQTADDTLRSDDFTPARYVYLSMKASAAHTKAANSSSSRTYKKIALYGDHDITLVDDPDGEEPDGLLASDIVTYLLSRWAPLLSPNGVETSEAWLPHFVIDEPTTAEEAIERANAADLFEWGVYEGREFFFRRPNPDRLVWEVRLSEGAHLDLEGEIADQVFNGVVVYFTNPSGESRTVGPVGSGSDAEDATLQDDDPTNPVNAHGIPRRWATLNVSQVTTTATATKLGATYLSEQTAPQRRGQVTVQGSIQHPTAGKRPGWAVRAGDWLRISDHPADVPRRIIETSYSERGLVMTLDNSAHRVEAILEALGAALVGVHS